MRVFILMGIYPKRGAEILGVYSNFSEAWKDKRSLLSRKRHILPSDDLELLSFESLYINAHDRLVADLEKLISELQDDLNECSVRKSSSSGEIERLEKLISELQYEIKRSERLIPELEDEIERSRKLMSELQDELDKLAGNPTKKSNLKGGIKHLKGLISKLDNLY
jgi:chromosome segregation ATPase